MKRSRSYISTSGLTVKAPGSKSKAPLKMIWNVGPRIGFFNFGYHGAMVSSISVGQGRISGPAGYGLTWGLRDAGYGLTWGLKDAGYGLAWGVRDAGDVGNAQGS